MARQTNRREFLTGVSAAEALTDAANRTPAAGEAPPEPQTRKSYLLHVERQAMACRFAVYLNPAADSTAPEAAIKALALVAELEDQLSVFREHSEVSQINRRAADEDVEVEPRLFDLLTQAIRLYEQTGGAFDITSGPLTKVWGFYRRQGRIPAPGELALAMQAIGSQWLQLDAARRTIQFLRPGIEINLGAIGKGYALDRAAELLQAEGVGDFLLHGGQSSVLARGHQLALGDSGRGWSVGIRHPVWTKRRLAEVDLRDKALGTSGAETQYFFYQGRRYGHILDPRTGSPASGVLTASVLAPDAASADALSTAFYVLGVEGATEYCERNPEISAVLATPGERSGSVVLHAIGVPETDLRFLEGDSHR